MHTKPRVGHVEGVGNGVKLALTGAVGSDHIEAVGLKLQRIVVVQHILGLMAQKTVVLPDAIDGGLSRTAK